MINSADRMNKCLEFNTDDIDTVPASNVSEFFCETL